MRGYIVSLKEVYNVDSNYILATVEIPYSNKFHYKTEEEFKKANEQFKKLGIGWCEIYNYDDFGDEK